MSARQWPVVMGAALLVGCTTGTEVRMERESRDRDQQTPAYVDRAGPIKLTEEGRRLHRSALVIDGHNDLAGKIEGKGNSSFDEMDISLPQPDTQTDIPRLREGGVGGQFWAAYVSPETMRTGGGVRCALEQIDIIHRMVQRYPDTFAMAYTADDIGRIHEKGKIASLIGIEGGHAIENSLAVLRMYYRLGARYMTLTHADTTDWADSATDEARHGGLTSFGENVVREMNRLGMLVDISHVSAETMRDVLRVSRAPIIASHSSAYAVAPHPRNVPDDVLRLIAENDGLVMVNFFSGFVDPEGARVVQDLFDVFRRFRAEHPDENDLREAIEEWRRQHPIPRGTVHTVVDHVDHIVKVAGVDHVGLGSDYDGINRLPEQLDDVSCFPYLTQELLNRGYAERDIRKILGENLLRVLRQAEQVSRDSGPAGR